jgi:hypothetical protein
MANIVFITNVNECPFEIIEFVMLFTKYYIHYCKWSNNLPTIEVLKAKLKNRENMERSNSIFKDKLKDHEDRWLKFLQFSIVNAVIYPLAETNYINYL